MQYNVGMYGGSFDPLHIGHINCIVTAASKCNSLYVVLSFSRKRDTIPMEIRYRWLVQAFRHMKNVKVILLEDAAVTKDEYDTDEYWQTGRDTVLKQIGSAVDVVFCGSDYLGSNRYEKLYNCTVEYIDRTLVPVSSTKIRENPMLCWEMIPDVCKPYFVKRVVFVGGESTGKTTIVRNLAHAYNTNYLEEVGRDICYDAGCEDTMIAEDFVEILVKHKAKEYDCLRHSNKILFEDTESLTTLWFSKFLLSDAEEQEKVEALANAIHDINSFDIVFFMEPTVPFVQDGTRNEKIALDRIRYSEQIKTLLDAHRVEYECLDGDYSERFIQAKNIINNKFGLKEI